MTERVTTDDVLDAMEAPELAWVEALAKVVEDRIVSERLDRYVSLHYNTAR